MKNEKVSTMILLPVPTELLEEIGLNPMQVIQMSIADGKLIIEKADDNDFKCDGECEECPFYEIDCDGDCENCPCVEECDESEDL